MTSIHERVAAAESIRYARALMVDRGMRAGVVLGADARPISGPDAAYDQRLLDDAGPTDAHLARLAGYVQARRRRPAVLKSFTKSDIEVPPIHPPSGAAYEKQLRKVLLNPLYKTMRERLSLAAGASMAYYEIMNMPMPDIAGLHSGVVKKYFNHLSGWHKKKIIAAFRAAIKIDVGVLLQDGPIRTALQDRIIDNVALIKTIPVKFQTDLKVSFLDEFAEAPFDRQRLTSMLSTAYDSAGYNLRRIARDQTTKAIGQFTELRQKQIGVEEYRWSSSTDNRVRPTHQLNEGKTFSWDDPPAATGHPGWDIQCRCVAVAIIPQPTPQVAPAPKPAVEPKPKPKPAVAPATAAPKVPLPSVSIPTAPPPPVVPPAAPPPPTTLPPIDFGDIDAAWAARLDAPDPFTFHGKAEVGGAHYKEFWLDTDGEKWMFKPAKRRADEFIAHGEESAYLIGRHVVDDAIEVRTVQLNGKLGSIQKWKDEAVGDFTGVAPVELSAVELEQIQGEQVIDWLVSNHDGHWGNFLRTNDGRVFGIDRGQAYKHLGEDRLSIGYHPNAVFGEREPLYNTIFRAAKEGDIEVDPAHTLAAIRRADSLTEDEFLAILKPYADGRFPGDTAAQNAFYRAAIDRKQNLKRDFEAFYADVLNDPRFRFGAAADEVPEVAAAIRHGRLGAAEQQLLDEVEDLGWQGKTLSVDKTDIEDQNALIFVEKFNGQTRTVVRFKLTQDGESKLMSNLGKAGVEAPTGAGERVAIDTAASFGEYIREAAKTVNYHVNDGLYNQAKMDSMLEIVDHLSFLKQHGADDEVKVMADYYLGWIKKVHAAAQNQTTVDDFSFYLLRETVDVADSGTAPFTVSKSIVRMTRRELRDGDLIALDDAATHATIFGDEVAGAGEQLNIDFGDDIRLLFRPSTEKKQMLTQRGEFEITIPGAPNTIDLDRALDHLETLGINSRIATEADAELLYLHKQAYLMKVDEDKGWANLVARLDTDDASPEARVSAMRGFFNRKLKVEDVTQLPSYNPAGEYQAAFKVPGGSAGYRQQMRFDMSDADLDEKMEGFGLFHALTNEETIPDFVDLVLSNNGAMISTAEKIRMGIPVGGMSPTIDMGTGGANYVFTRILRSPGGRRKGKKGLYFKKKMLRRQDAISYKGDAYGDVSTGYIREHRGSSVADWKKFSKVGNNETIFKNSITLLDNIDVFRVTDAAERTELLKVFRKHGVSVLEDGRRVEDIIVVP